MSLSQRAKDALEIALADQKASVEVSTAIDSGSNPQAATVAAIPASTDLALASPAAAALALDTPAAASLNAVFDDTEVEGALDAKADQVDVANLAADMNTALDLKADQTAVAAMMATAESRLDALEAKVNAVISALKAAGLMAS